MPAGDLPGLIRHVHAVLSAPEPADELAATTAPIPAVPIKRSVFPDHIVCLEDGKKLKMLKRHLRSAFGMTPDQYRERWGLPSDYPMVAPDEAVADVPEVQHLPERQRRRKKALGDRG